MSEPTAPTATGLHAQPQLAPGTVLAGRFRIDAMLGVGGMGVVYRATDLALEVPVALKLLRPELATRADAFERFRQELLMARQVSSPRVVRIHDLAQHQGQWLISMDLVDGEGLDRRIDRDGAMPADAAVRIARQLAEGLAAAHARGVIHRDLKPANVLIDRNGDAYISDFGVARSLASNGLTQSGAIVGTPDYLSPEQARGDAVDGRSDLYALGLILYEMLTGAMPFQGGTLGEILAQRMLRTPPPVTQQRPQTPAWLARLVDRLLRTQPGHRLQSADEVIRAIDRREVPRDFRPSPRLWLGIAAALVVAAIGVGVWQWQRSAVPAGIAAVAPLHRLLVLPIEAGDGISAARGAALSALLHESLAGVTGLAVVDAERTQQALRQLDPTGAAKIDTATLQRIVGADRVLQVSTRQVAGRWQANARLLGTRANATAQSTGSDAAAALSGLLAQPELANALGLGTQRLTLKVPANAQALDDYGNGLLARQRNAPADALPPLRKATVAAPQFASAWLALADAAQAIGEQDLAYDAVERGARAATRAPESMRRRFSAERALLDGDAPAAAAEWRALLAATPDDTYAELQLARALGGGGDFAAAIAGLQKLAARDPNDPRAWFELGKASILQGQARRAVDDYLVRALVLYKRSGNRYGEAETVNALGIGYGRLGQADDAEEQYRKAVELRRAVGNRRGLATSLRNLGSVLSQRGKLAEAATYLNQARALHGELDDRGGLAAVENELGLLAEERGDYPAALAAFRRSLQARQQIGDKLGTAQALNDIGFAHYQLGAYDDAQAYLVQSANAYAELGDDTGRIRTQQNLGLLAIARGQWNEARKQLDRSLAVAEQQQMHEEAAVSRRNLAELELLQGHLDTAIEQASKAEALFGQREDARGQADAGLLRVQALLAAHADAAARTALDALAAPIAQASAEQRGIAALLRAQLARRGGDRAAQATALAEARRQAQASGVRLLQLQVALQATGSGGTDPALDAASAALGHAGLRLQWTQAAMQHALETRDAGTAVRLYRDALPLLRRGDTLGAAELHGLGARALTAQGDSVAAMRASDSASAAMAVLRTRMPENLRTGFDAAAQIAQQSPPKSGPAR
ncbi:protein kinase [Lysobacter koreensis]|uniref:Protein kinase n=1 Tax=Lysobacter koreensis TaxID=266122 RepID=A0ABW2YSN0_9GAMM